MDDASIGVVGSSSFKSTVIGGQWMTPALELWDHHHSSLLSLEAMDDASIGVGGIIIIQVYYHWRAMDDAALELWDHHHSSLLSLEGNG